MTFSISLCSTPRPCMAIRTRLRCVTRSAPCSRTRTPPQLKLHNARNATERRVLHAFSLSSLLALEPSTRTQESIIPEDGEAQNVEGQLAISIASSPLALTYSHSACMQSGV